MKLLTLKTEDLAVSLGQFKHVDILKNISHVIFDNYSVGNMRKFADRLLLEDIFSNLLG